tara:strand:- start:4534 stop:4782 length:249 start_codon:yes stop_codon:yes gene_type:complete
MVNYLFAGVSRSQEVGMHGVYEAGCLYRPGSSVQGLCQYLAAENTRWASGTQSAEKVLVELLDLEKFKKFVYITGHEDTPGN